MPTFAIGRAQQLLYHLAIMFHRGVVKPFHVYLDRASISTLGGFSAHAGRTDLLKWFAPLAASRPQVILTHGEDTPRKNLAAAIQQQFNLTSQLPSPGDIVDVSHLVCAA